jgi:hypothetical protein
MPAASTARAMARFTSMRAFWSSATVASLDSSV